MERAKTVVDASVAIKWFVQEPLSQNAEKILQEHIEGKRLIFAPDLVIYEVGNALHFRGLAVEDVKRAFQDMADFQLHIEKATITLVLNAVRLARSYKLTVYDAAYAALAEVMGAELITADEKVSTLPFARSLGRM